MCDHVAIPRRRAVDEHDVVRHGRHTQLARRAHDQRPPAESRLRSRVPTSTPNGEGVLHHRRAQRGRAILGIGAGHVEAEFDLLGISFGDRGKLTDKALDTIRAAFADEWGTGDFGQRPRPLQPNGPPIWVGGSSNAAIRRAAERGDGWLPQGTLKKDMPAAIERLHELRDAAGRHGDFTIGAIVPFLYVGDAGWDTGKGCLAGEAEKLAGYLRDYAAMGVDQVQVRFRSRTCDELCDQIRAFATNVVPMLDDNEE